MRRLNYGPLTYERLKEEALHDIAAREALNLVDKFGNAPDEEVRPLLNRILLRLWLSRREVSSLTHEKVRRERDLYLDSLVNLITQIPCECSEDVSDELCPRTAAYLEAELSDTCKHTLQCPEYVHRDKETSNAV